MVQHKQSYHIDQSVNKTSSKIDSTYPGCPLNVIATDVLRFSLKPCLILSDDPQVRAAVRQKTAGEQLAEQGEYLEGGIGVMNTSIIDKAQDICDRARLSDVIESYGVRLKRSGAELKGLCPFHSGIHPQF